MTAPDPGQAALADWLANAWAQTARVADVAVEGATVRYRAWGDDGAKPGLVFVHGFRAHARWWDHIAPHFTDRYRVIALDFTGMGDSDRRPAYSRRQFGREILACADHAGFDRPTLIAHSFGSASALYACALAPERIPRAIIVDAHIFRDEFEGEPPMLTPERFYPTREAALSRYRLTPPGAWPDRQVLAYIGEHSLRETPKGWTWKFDSDALPSLHGEKLRNDIRNLTTPIDFVYGDRSELVGPAEVAALLANTPTCGVPVVIPLAHHHVMIEQPVALVAALRGLLANPRSW